ncbi:hypothetical protein B5P44_20780 [Mycobacterium sp. CBMA 213]|uniref:DUF7373 family lipoprotein n=1 Tax=unclassified Mycolicibacterium TaxID=2636767 RepID=UPI0012DC28D5|nr:MULTISPECIES: hypothetical protein [unclassified Mycolicibacterium]MUL57775.1 hypothetical protein [Mycolicibacterium sp. CBMA 335]MUM07207.1 hypothetical protein [Mycolicibacterium sp. CBMA 213]
MAASICALTACSTTTSGTARFGGSLSDPEPDASQLRTGNYQIKPSTPYFSAGPNPSTQSIVESTRLAEFVVGPWEVDSSLTFLVTQGTHSVDANSVDLVLGESPDKVMQRIAATHNLVAGFGSQRMTGPGEPDLAVKNVVLMFPDDAQAAAAAGEFAAQIGPVVTGGIIPIYPVDVFGTGNPTPGAAGMNINGTTSAVAAYTVNGRYVFYQLVRAKDSGSATAAMRAGLLVSNLISRQRSLIKGFVPTEPSKLADLPKDPSSDQLLSKTLSTPDQQAGFLIGAWRPHAWLHFEADPVSMNAQFERAGVQWVTQRWGRIYQAPNSDSAAQLLDFMTASLMHNADMQLAGPVPGFPGARCFERQSDYSPPDAAVSMRIEWWHYSCVAHTDRFVFQVFGDDETAVNQQISAQYRVLSGK